MAIKPVTFQGVTNFKSNLYALEVKSRFIDQSKADGYYLGYGQELAASISGSTVTVGSGAFLVQGRQVEIETGGEAVSVTIQNGYYGYIIARIETYRPNDNACCTLIAKTGASLADITLTKQDTYARTSETENKVYELPLYSFRMTGGNITNLTKVITAVQEATETRNIANNAVSTANGAVTTANNAVSTANTASQNASAAVTTANTAASNASAAVTTANTAASNASAAVSTANTANTKAETAKTTANTAASNASAAVTTANNAKATAEDAAARVDSAIAAAANLVYPVGSIYMSVSNTSPASLFGGTWTTFGAGRALVGINTSDTDFNTVEKTGGEKTHTLTTSEMPSHKHPYGIRDRGYGGIITFDTEQGSIHNNAASGSGFPAMRASLGVSEIDGAIGQLHINNTGGDGAHNNLQPYITVYMWKRVS